MRLLLQVYGTPLHSLRFPSKFFVRPLNLVDEPDLPRSHPHRWRQTLELMAESLMLEVVETVVAAAAAAVTPHTAE